MDIGISMDAYLNNCSNIEAINKLCETGFDSLDFNLSDFCHRDDSPLLKSNYERRCFEACTIMNIDYVVFHPMYFDLGVNEKKYNKTLNYNSSIIIKNSIISLWYECIAYFTIYLRFTKFIIY